jgi:hypothetical protein
VSLPNAAVCAEEIALSPAWLPLDAAGPGDTRLLRLDETAYRAASFLDQRLLTAGPPTAMVTASTVAMAAARLAPGAHYIFHIGHVGSTLVSRLVGEFAGLFSVREPTLIREAALQGARASAQGPAMSGAMIPRGMGLRDALALLARTWRPGERAVVKATSFASEIADSILAIDPDAAAILMFTPAPAYLRCILGGPNSRTEARVLAPARLARLRRRLAESALAADPQSEGEWIAMSWLCEMTCLQQAGRRFASRVLWVDFDEFLAAPRAGLEAIVTALGITARPQDIDVVLGGPLMHRYSKAPEHAYDAALRHDVLASAEREHPTEIRRGMAWLEALGARHPAVAEVLGR